MIEEGNANYILHACEGGLISLMNASKKTRVWIIDPELSLCYVMSQV